MLYPLVQMHFDAFIKSKFSVKPEVLKFLLNHERKNKCIDKTCEQIKIMELRSNIQMNAAKVEVVARSSAELFCKAALEYAEQQALSRVETLNRISKHDQFKQLEKQFEQDQTILESLS